MSITINCRQRAKFDQRTKNLIPTQVLVDFLIIQAGKLTKVLLLLISIKFHIIDIESDENLEVLTL